MRGNNKNKKQSNFETYKNSEDNYDDVEEDIQEDIQSDH
jgi:hypothetical protein